MAAQRYSQNGWPAYADTSNYTRFTAAGQGWWAANADVAVVFTEFIERFVAEVEAIAGTVLDDWSYANRLVRGSATVVSNHGSATAIDINALKHPRGVKNTFSTAKATAVRKIKNAITDDSGQPVLRLGMDYTTTVDDMHVEINASGARVKQAANKIRAAKAAAREDDDVSFKDQHILTAADVKAYGQSELKVGQTKSYDELVRFSPAVARMRREMLANFGAISALVVRLTDLLVKGEKNDLTPAQILALTKQGAAQALAEAEPDEDDTTPPAGAPAGSQ